MVLRVVDGRPVSAVTTQCLTWPTERLAAEDKTALLMVWDNTSWHVSHALREWLKAYRRRVKREGAWGLNRTSTKFPCRSWLEPD
jgi:hypothetical protein